MILNIVDVSTILWFGILLNRSIISFGTYFLGGGKFPLFLPPGSAIVRYSNGSNEHEYFSCHCEKAFTLIDYFGVMKSSLFNKRYKTLKWKVQYFFNCNWVNEIEMIFGACFSFTFCNYDMKTVKLGSLTTYLRILRIDEMFMLSTTFILKKQRP